MLELRRDRPHLPNLPNRRVAPRRLVDLIWSDRRIGLALAALVAAPSGLAVALAMPRGPVTAAQALALMGTGLAVGLVAGSVSRSRWAMLAAPVAHVAVFELARLGADGPTVDGIHPGGVFGVLAFLAGRGFYGVAGVLPMLVGVAYGAALARRVAGAPAQRRRLGLHLRRGFTALISLGLVALAVLIGRPATVPPIRDANGHAVPGSIASLEKVRIGGVDQWIEIRAWSPDRPVLLSIPGGPGQSDLALSRPTLGTLAKDFVVVTWDQRGTGKSYPSFDAARITTDRAVSDTVELTNYLRKRFDEQKIYLFGESGGSVIGVLAVQRHPELYHAWIGSGQMVDLQETDRRIYRDLLAYAARHGDRGLAATLRGSGAPPYRDVWAYAYVLGQYEKLEGDYDPPQAYTDALDRSGVGFFGIAGSEYAPVDKLNVLRGLVDTFGVLYPQWQTIDFRRTAERLRVPAYLFTGSHELAARRDLALDWFRRLQAPEKRLYSYEDAGHATAFEHFQDFHRIMRDTIVPATYGAR